MAALPKNIVDHISHADHDHSLKSTDNNQGFLCNGCKTFGKGKRYRCNGCDFDLHNYCGTCPRVLSSFMHHHSLDRKPQNARQGRMCDVCRDPIQGLFYRCKECEFDVHPLCTQLPEKLHHALHKIHPLILQPLLPPNYCGVCRNWCTGWHYKCGICNFGIHLECVLAPVVPCLQHDQRVPFQPQPQFAPYYSFPYSASYSDFGSGFNTYHGGLQQNLVPQNYQVGASNNGIGTGQLGKSMFTLVGQLGFGVISNMIFGVDISSLYAG